MTDNTRAIIDYADNDQGKEARDAFYAALHDKVMAHLEVQKQSIAQNILTTPEETPTQEQETEGENV